jgi:hypothetical protein
MATMSLHPLEWLLAGATVGLGLALIAAPLALTPKLSSLYVLHGTMSSASTLSRLMLSSWLPPLMAALPVATAIYCTVTPLRPGRRRVLLVVALVAILVAGVFFLQGLLAPIVTASGQLQ